MIAAVTVGMLVTLALAGAGALRGDAAGRLVAVQLTSAIAVQLTLVLSLQPHVPYYADVALLLAVAAFVGSITFARFLERWL